MKKHFLAACLSLLFIVAACSKEDDTTSGNKDNNQNTNNNSNTLGEQGKLSYKVVIPNKLKETEDESVRINSQTFVSGSVFHSDTALVRQNEKVSYSISYNTGFQSCDKVLVEATFNGKLIYQETLIIGWTCTPVKNGAYRTLIIP